MYLFFKKIVKKVLPQKLLFIIEPSLRKVYALLYRGNNYHCSVCDSSFKRFIQLKNGELVCPRCGSLPRDRRLFDILMKESLIQEI
jgi:DNA-directed RNA polymerase subunit RPC12/RpoP